MNPPWVSLTRDNDADQWAERVLIDPLVPVAHHGPVEFLAEPIFDSLRRWAHGRLGDGSDGEIPAEATVAAMDAAGVRTGMLCA